MLQTTNYTNSITELELRTGFKYAIKAITRPRETINQIGFNAFAHSELIPFGFSKTTSQWIPNYMLHLVGGGTEYARMTDYYAYHNFKHPRIWAAATSLTEQLLNEAVEMRGREKLYPSVVADWYFFNIPSLFIFSIKPVQYFFSHVLITRSWLGQASYSPGDHSIRNTGQYYSIKVQPRFLGNFSMLYYMGAGWLFGGGYDLNGITYSVGYGTKTEEVFVVDEERKIEYVKLTPSAGLFIDKENSLLFSLVVTTNKVYQENIRVDLFPGIIKIGNFSPGLWMNYSFESVSYFGITFRGLPGIAF